MSSNPSDHDPGWSQKFWQHLNPIASTSNLSPPATSNPSIPMGGLEVDLGAKAANKLQLLTERKLQKVLTLPSGGLRRLVLLSNAIATYQNEPESQNLESEEDQERQVVRKFIG